MCTYAVLVIGYQWSHQWVSSYAKAVQRHLSDAGNQSNGDNTTGQQLIRPGSNGRFFDTTEHWISQDEPGECVPTAQSSKPAPSSRRFGEHSLLLRRIVIPQESPQVQLEIQSAELQQVFRDVTCGLDTVNVQADPIVIPAPYYELYHFRDELEAVRLVATTNDKLKRELHLFRDFERDHLSRIIDLAAIRDYTKEGTISFEYLWALFKPHDLILMQCQGTTSSRLLFCAILQTYWVDVSKGRWYIKVRYLSYHAGQFGPVEKVFQFIIFPGTVKIDSLPAFPLGYSDSQDTIRKALKSRGRHFIQLCKESSGGMNSPSNRKGGTLRSYNGPVWIQRERYKPDGTDFFDAPEETIAGRIVVDPISFVSEYPEFRETILHGTLFPSPDGRVALGSGPKSDSNRSLNRPSPIDTNDLTQDELICFPAMIAGYSLTTKHRGFFPIDGFADVAWEDTEAERLFESSSNMKAVRNIISGFSYESGSFGYSISGKGKGLVFLFFGPSGTGKTLTAECVAENLRRPLYRVSGSDLGSSPRQIENNLQTAFNRITRWQAILLLDEADAFMAERADESLERNTLVSILLRLLEYQPGIIILTTNRQDHFDKAFKSRIHVTINFPALGQRDREVVWRNQVRIVRAIESEPAPPSNEASTGQTTTTGLTDEDFVALSKLELDGRSIKNVYHVAGLYARAKGAESYGVSLADLKAVLQIALGDVSPGLKKQLDGFCQQYKASD